MTVAITSGVVRNGECDAGCLTKTTCRFWYDVTLVVQAGAIARTVVWLCPTDHAGAPSDPPCASSTAYYYAPGFTQQSSGYDIVCGRSEQMVFNVVQNPDGTGETIGTLRFNCDGCTAGSN
ncbi:MAG: hypothetical protein U1F36_23885 [Planctomycetota bacterium]